MENFLGIKGGQLDDRQKKNHDAFFIEEEEEYVPADGPLTAPVIIPEEVMPDTDLCVKEEVQLEKAHIDWESFKADVGLKHMILEIDIAILLRQSILHVDDPVMQAKLNKVRHFVEKTEWLKLGCFWILFLISFFEKPSWCVMKAKAHPDNDEYQHTCGGRDYPHQALPFMSPAASISLSIICLLVILVMVLLKDTYRKDTVSIRNQRMLMVITIFFSLIDLLVVLFNINNSQVIKDYSYPWICELLKPVLAIGLYRQVRSYAKRFLFVITSAISFVACIIVYVYFFSYMGMSLYAFSIEGGQTFTDIRTAFWTLFITLTTSNFPNVMLPSYNVNRICAAFFLIYLIIGLFLLMNLVLALIYTAYQNRTEMIMDDKAMDRTYYFKGLFEKIDKEDKGFLVQEEVREMLEEIHSLMSGTYSHEKMEISEQQFSNYWATIDHNQDGKCYLSNTNEVIQTYDIWRFEKNRKEEIHDMYDTDPTLFRSRLFWYVSHPYYEMASNMLCILNFVMIYVGQLSSSQDSKMAKGPITAWLTFEILFNLVQSLELILDIYANGSIGKAFSRKFRCSIELSAQLFFWYGFIWIIAEGVTIDNFYIRQKPFQLVIFIRLLKLLPLLEEVKQYRLILTTMSYMLEPIQSIFAVTFLIFFQFAVVGAYLFGGVISNDNEFAPWANGGSYFTLMNFNDITSSLVTLYALMIVNNWYVMVNQATDFMGDQNYRFYFYVFYFAGVVLAANILIAFAIDIYSVVLRLDECRHQNRALIYQMLEDHDIAMKQRKDALAKQTDENREYESTTSVE